MIIIYKAKFEDTSYPIKTILKEKLNISNRLLTTLKNNNTIFLNDIPTKINCPLMANDVIKIKIKPDIPNHEIKPEKIDLDILYEDNYLIILNKKANIVVHPTYLHPNGTIANGLAYYFKQNNMTLLIRPVSRLDRDTTGIIIFAKNAFVQECLIKQMKNKLFKKEYIGIVEGLIKNDTGTINAPIARDNNSIIKRCVAKNGLESITHFKVLKRYKDHTLVLFTLETGRTHQIRVHCNYIKHPLVGDGLYNPKTTPAIDRQALHSSEVEFIHPISNKALKLTAPTPYDLKSLLCKLNNNSN